jgi:hypothetical protein
MESGAIDKAEAMTEGQVVAPGIAPEIEASGDMCEAVCDTPQQPAQFATSRLNAMRTGIHSELVRKGLLPEQQEAVQAMHERRAAIVSDLGDDLSQVKQDVLQRYLEASLIADYLFDNIQHLGVLTGKGRTRAACSAYLQVLDRQVRLGQMLGFERKAKQVPNPADWLAGKS